MGQDDQDYSQVRQDDQDDQDSKMTDKCYPGTQCTITSTTKTIQEGRKESPASHRDARAPRVATKAQDFLGTEVYSAREILELGPFLRTKSFGSGDIGVKGARFRVEGLGKTCFRSLKAAFRN